MVIFTINRIHVIEFQHCLHSMSDSLNTTMLKLRIHSLTRRWCFTIVAQNVITRIVPLHTLPFITTGLIVWWFVKVPFVSLSFTSWRLTLSDTPSRILCFSFIFSLAFTKYYFHSSVYVTCTNHFLNFSYLRNQGPVLYMYRVEH